jgi:hypothetical protein
MTDCPARPQLARLLNGELANDAEGDVSAHLETCPRCQQVLEELTAVHSAARPPAPPPGVPTGRVSDAELHRLRGLLPPGSRSSPEVPALPAPATWPAVPGYEVLRELGRGGMAVVYEARQLRLNRLVALKMIRAADLAAPEQLVRFIAEGETVARLRHPNIVQIYEVGSHERRPYLALELMEGGNLSQALASKPPPSWSRRWPAPPTTPTGKGSCTATSTRPTCCCRRAAAPDSSIHKTTNPRRPPSDGSPTRSPRSPTSAWRSTLARSRA